MTGRTILRRAFNNISEEADAYTDEYPAYHVLDGCWNHQTVNHSLGQYARDGGVHINTVEGEFSVFRPWMATYRGISKENLYLYCAQYNFLRNTRKENRVARTIGLITLPFKDMEKEPCTTFPI